MSRDKGGLFALAQTLGVGALCAGILGIGASAKAAEIVRTPIPNSNFPISAAVTVPAGSDLIYVSGALPAVANPSAPANTTASFGTTEVQTVSVLKRLEATLSGLGLTLSDVVQLHVYLVGDPDKGGKLDFAGLQAGYTQFFGTKEQPNLPARSAVQVAALVVPGALVEIEAIAARTH